MVGAVSISTDGLLICSPTRGAPIRRLHSPHFSSATLVIKGFPTATYTSVVSVCTSAVDERNRQDEEHKLIARYTSRLAETEGSGVSPQEDSCRTLTCVK